MEFKVLKLGPTPRTLYLEEYRKSRFVLWSVISSAKRQYKDKVTNLQGSNNRNVCAGLKTITDYKRKTSSAEVSLHLR